MVLLNRIYTRTGDAGETRLATGQQVAKTHPRVEAYGAVDETNAHLGVCRLHTGEDPWLEAVLARIQNELFDLGADLSTPQTADRPDRPALRMTSGQVERLEKDIDEANRALEPLTSFVLPAGSALATHLHVARTVCRRAERDAVRLAEADAVNPEAIKYLNRLSDLLFVASRRANGDGADDVLWRPGGTR